MLSFSASIHQNLGLPAQIDGILWPPSDMIKRYPPHRHDELEMNLMLSGTATYVVGDRRYRLARHSLVWLFPEQDHVLIDKSLDCRYWVVVFKEELVRRVCRADSSQALLLGNPAGHFCRRLTQREALTLSTLLQRLAEELAQERYDPFNAGLGYGLALSWEMFQRADESLGESLAIHPAVSEAIRLIREEADPLSVEEIARRAGISPTHLSRLFARQMGAPLAQFRNRQRLDRFFVLYKEGRGMSMLNAALAAGFGSYAQFYRVFRELMACGPAEYRRAVLAGRALS